MALSNTAVPKYYGMFRDAVIRGEIPVNKEISMEMNRIDDLIANPGVYYDDKAVEGFILYCENELTLTDGSDLNLLDSFKVWSEQIFGWYYFVERSVYEPSEDGHGGHYVKKHIRKRLINKQYLIVARGAAKSMYGSCLQNYFLNVDITTTHQITTAPTMKQAEEVLSPIRTAITRSRGPFYKFLTDGSIMNTSGSKANRVKLASTKKGIENFLTGSLLEIRPMRIDKLQGLQLKVATVDEWLSGDIREDVIGAIEQGASKVDDYLIVAISSEGTVRNGAGDTIKMELQDILKGEYINPHVSIWWYKLDSVEEVSNPDMWLKANPNLGKTVSYETYQLDVERAEKAPAARNDILAKRFGLPMEGYTYYFTYEETLPHRKRDFWQLPCSLGGDLSQGDDFCAFTFLFPLSNGAFGVKTRNYITQRTLMKLQPAMRLKYEEFIKEGSLIVMEGTVLDMMEVYEDLDNHIIESGYDVRCFGYDPYNAKDFVERWTQENGVFGVEKVIQGAKTESVPLGELKKLSEDRMLLFDEELMTFTMGNCITLEDTNGNRKLLKKRYDQKDIEEQLSGSKYGIAYIDGTEHVTQLNRSVENNLMKQIEYLTSMLYSQLGITQSILDGTADEKTMLNYYNRTIEPILSAIVDEMKRKFLTKTARTKNKSIKFFRDPFKLVPISEIAEITDKFTRNEVASSNEMRQVIGWKPSNDPKADELRNSNLSESKSTNIPQETVGDNTSPDTSEYDNLVNDLLDSLSDEIDSIVGEYLPDSEEGGDA